MSKLVHLSMQTAEYQVKDPARWLLGCWRSDKEKTLSEWQYAPGKRKAMRAILERDLGKLIHKFSPKYSSTYTWFEDKWFRSRYEIKWKNSESLFIVLRSAGEEEQGMHLRFVSQHTYWIHAGKNIEYFSRIPLTEAPQAMRKPELPGKGAR